jgi:ribonuclease HI
MFIDNTHGRIAEHPSLLLHVDGGCEPKNPGGVVTAGWVLYDTDKPGVALVEQGKVVRDGGPLATNNFGEYSSLGLALAFLVTHNWKGELTIKADSKLLVEQVNGRWKCKAEHLKGLRERVWTMLEDLSLQLVNEAEPLPPEGKTACHLVHVRRELNGRPDELCHLAYEEHLSSK